jgi:RNA polymerase sigma-70 factor (ECF subfamily)
MTSCSIALMEARPRLGSAPGASDDDAALLRSYLRNRDPELFARLVRRHEASVFRLVVSILGPAHGADAEDVTQDIFVHVYHKLDNFRFASRFSTWLYRIAYRKAIDEKRRARYRHPHVGEELLAQRPESSVDPQQGALGREAAQALRKQVAELTEPYRSAVLLYYWMDLPVEEISRVLGAKATTVRSYLHRARAKLRQDTEAAE